MIGDRIPQSVIETYHSTVDAALAWMCSSVTSTYRMPLWKQGECGIYLWWRDELLWMEPLITEHLGKPSLETFLEESELRVPSQTPKAVRIVAAAQCLQGALLRDMARHRPYVLGERSGRAPVELP